MKLVGFYLSHLLLWAGPTPYHTTRSDRSPFSSTFSCAHILRHTPDLHRRNALLTYDWPRSCASHIRTGAACDSVAPAAHRRGGRAALASFFWTLTGCGIAMLSVAPRSTRRAKLLAMGWAALVTIVANFGAVEGFIVECGGGGLMCRKLQGSLSENYDDVSEMTEPGKSREVRFDKLHPRA